MNSLPAAHTNAPGRNTARGDSTPIGDALFLCDGNGFRINGRSFGFNRVSRSLR
jgi:hypothetical protein